MLSLDIFSCFLFCMFYWNIICILWFFKINLLLSQILVFFLSFVNYRKKKAVHKTTTTDDKRLQSTLKRIGVNAIPAIEEVNIFKDDVVIQFTNPKGKATQPYILGFLPSLSWYVTHLVVSCYLFQFRLLSRQTHGLLVVLLKRKVRLILTTFEYNRTFWFLSAIYI